MSTPHEGVDLDRNDHAHVWRRYVLQSAHRLPNVKPGHKCGRMHGHGFEVILHADQDLGAREISVDYDHLDETLGADPRRARPRLPERHPGPREPHQRDDLRLDLATPEAPSCPNSPG